MDKQFVAGVIKRANGLPEGQYNAIISTEKTDRHGDNVEGWITKEFEKNPVLLWQHSHSTPIGKWMKVRVVGKNLVGTFELLRKGTSEFIDTIHALLEQKVLAISAGFIPGEVIPKDASKPWEGSILKDNVLLEASLVSVPANSGSTIDFAKAVKSMNLGEDTLSFLKAIESDSQKSDEPSKTTQSRDSDDKGKSKTPKPKGDKLMSLSERIKAAQAEIKASREELDNIETVAKSEDREVTDDEITQMDVLAEDIEKSVDQLGKLERIEKSKAQRIVAAASETGTTKTVETKSTETPNGVAFGEGARNSSVNKTKGHRASAVVASVIRGHVNQSNPADMAKTHYENEPEIAILVKAATAPARSDVAGWAQELVQDTWTEFQQLLRDISIYTQLPGTRLSFDGFGKINVPRQQGRGQLSGGFVAEGAAIPVKEGAVDQTDLTPKGLKVISSFTREMAMRSNPSIEGMIQSQIMEDTAEVLDDHYMGATVRDGVFPGGIQDAAETGAGNIVVSTGDTTAAIQTDTKSMIARLITSRFTSAVWVMNPVRVLSLMDIQDAASGVFLYKAELAAGTFRGFPYISSGNVPEDIVLLQATNAVTFASEQAMQISASDSASLHYEDTTPADDIGGATTPVRSLFQTDSIALRMTQFLDHRQVRANGRQVLTSVSW